MDASSFSSFTQVYKIEGIFYTAHANFMSNKITISWDNVSTNFHMDDYTNFFGSMEDFVTQRVVNVNERNDEGDADQGRSDESHDTKAGG